jgi:hypothetical protein
MTSGIVALPTWALGTSIKSKNLSKEWLSTQRPLSKERYTSDACISGSQTCNHSDAPMQWQTVPGDIMHSNICRWIDPVALEVSKYFLTFTDDATCVMYLFVLKSKSVQEVCICFMVFLKTFEQNSCKVKSIRIDSSREYQKQMEAFYRELGICHEEAAPYTPEQNVVTERVNRTICECICAILVDMKLPKEP